MKKFRLKTGHLLLLAFLAGSGWAILRTFVLNDSAATVVNGSWEGHKKMNLGEDLLLTARIATQATFALDPSEVLYMIGRKDSEGSALSSEFEYLITGNINALKARYWSITLYGEDLLLVPNELNKWSFNLFDLAGVAPDGSFSIKITNDLKSGPNILPSPSGGPFYLLLRMYHPEKELYENQESIDMPEVRRIAK